MALLDTTLAADGQASFVMPGSNAATLIVSGTIGGGTLTVKVRKGSSVASTLYTVGVNEARNIEVAAGLECLLVLTGSTTPSLRLEAAPFKEIR